MYKRQVNAFFIAAAAASDISSSRSLLSFLSQHRPMVIPVQPVAQAAANSTAAAMAMDAPLTELSPPKNVLCASSLSMAEAVEEE